MFKWWLRLRIMDWIQVLFASLIIYYIIELKLPNNENSSKNIFLLIRLYWVRVIKKITYDQLG